MNREQLKVFYTSLARLYTVAVDSQLYFVFSPEGNRIKQGGHGGRVSIDADTRKAFELCGAICAAEGWRVHINKEGGRINSLGASWVDIRNDLRRIQIKGARAILEDAHEEEEDNASGGSDYEESEADD